jgi:hypothetical protein
VAFVFSLPPASTSAPFLCDRHPVSWEAPERRWQFLIGGDPPRDLPASWAWAVRAVTSDIGCRRHGRDIEFHHVMWSISADQGAVCVGFALDGAADVDAYQRCRGYQLVTSPAQAAVWLADDVQYELAGYEFVQWPITGGHLLLPRLVDDRAVWLHPTTGTVVAPIGALCRAGTDN